MAAALAAARRGAKMSLLCTALLLAFWAPSASAGHNLRSEQPGGGCVKPGQCKPPPAKFSRVLPVTPRQQWNSAGGFCGSMSIQTNAMAHGAWISQDLVRKANTFGAGHCDGGTPGHPGERDLGCEVGALNIGETAR